MDETPSAPKRRPRGEGNGVRRARIFARLREGWAYDEIARDEGVSAERIRQIVRETLEKRLLDEDTDHAQLQLARLQPALRIASAAIADGDVSAIAPFIKVLDRFDRYQRIAKVNQIYDDEARRKLLDKLNSMAANLCLDLGPEAPADEAAEARTSGETGQGGDKEKNLGIRRKSLKRLNPDKLIKVNSFE